MENKRRLSGIIEQAESGLDYHMKYFRMYWAAYNALIKQDVNEYLKANGKSNIPIYYIMGKIQRIRADFVEGYFTNKQFAIITEKKTLNENRIPLSIVASGYIHPTKSQSNKEKVRALQNAVDYYTIDDENINLYINIVQAFDFLTAYGTVALKVYWKNGSVKIETKEIKDIKFDKKATNFQDSKYIVEDIYLTREDVETNINNNIFDAQFDINKIFPKTDDPAEQFKRQQIQEVYEFKKGKWYVSTIYNKDVILRENKELLLGNPFIVGKLKNRLDDPEGNDDVVRIYGDAIIAPLVSIQREMTALRNQQLDIVNRQLNPRYISNDKNMNPFDFSNQNLAIVKGDPSKTKEINTPNLRDSNFNVDRLSVEGQEAIGVTDYNSGTSSNKQLNDTATGISILTTESNKILAYYMRACNETLIKPLFRKIALLVWNYGDAKFFYGVDRTENIEFSVGVNVGLGATNPNQRLNAKNTAFTGMLNLAQMTGDPERLKKAEEFYYKEVLPLLGVENYEEYLNENRRESGILPEDAGEPSLARNQQFYPGEI